MTPKLDTIWTKLITGWLKNERKHLLETDMELISGMYRQFQQISKKILFVENLAKILIKNLQNKLKKTNKHICEGTQSQE